MIPFIIRRLALLPVNLFGVTLLVFALFSRLSAGQRAALSVSDLPRSPDAVQRVSDRYGLTDIVGSMQRCEANPGTDRA